MELQKHLDEHSVLKIETLDIAQKTDLTDSGDCSVHKHDDRYYTEAEITTALALKANDNAVVKLTGDQTVAGVKTFGSIPVLPASNPTTDNQAARKAYVDAASLNKFASGITSRDNTAASGNQTIAHGLGITPKHIKMTVFLVDCYSFGNYDGTTYSCIVYRIDTSSGSAFAFSDRVIYAGRDTSASSSQSATCSLDATNITLAWTKTGTPPAGTIYIMWEAYY